MRALHRMAFEINARLPWRYGFGWIHRLAVAGTCRQILSSQRSAIRAFLALDRAIRRA